MINVVLCKALLLCGPGGNAVVKIINNKAANYSRPDQRVPRRSFLTPWGLHPGHILNFYFALTVRVVEPLEPFFFSAAYFVSDTSKFTLLIPAHDRRTERFTKKRFGADASNQPVWIAQNGWMSRCSKSLQQTMNHFKMVCVMCQQL